MTNLAAAADRQLVLGVLDALLEHPAVGRRLAAVDALELGLRFFELAPRTLVVDLARRDGVVHQRNCAVLLHLEEARAGRELTHAFLAFAEVDARRPRLQRRDQRRVAGEHADLAGRTGDDQHRRLTLEGRAVRRDERNGERLVGHGLTYDETPAG